MKMGGQADPRYLNTGHLKRFAEDIGVESRTVKAQLKELSGKLEQAAIHIASLYRQESRGAKITEERLMTIEKRIRKATTLVN